jgi:glycosyltransferase involved in cell wall biosynthesis
MITIIVPYYRGPKMLRLHLDAWSRYAPETMKLLRLIVVDDGSPEPAEPVIRSFPDAINLPLALYRVKVDIPWNRGGARNLGSQIAVTPWLLHVDTDHILPPGEADKLVNETPLRKDTWYRFRRFRVGTADETRKKDAIADDVTFGEIKPHGDSYLVQKHTYWKVGGYDEDYSGCLGGGSPFLAQLAHEAGMPQLLPVALHVYTRNVCPDASVSTLDRDTSEYMRRKQQKARAGKTRARHPIRFEWEKVI